MSDQRTSQLGTGMPVLDSDLVMVARAGVSNLKLTTQQLLAAQRAMRNGFINASMEIAQRFGTGGSVALTTAMAYGPVDRWAGAQITSANGFMQHFAITGLPGFRRALRIGRNPGAVAVGNLVAAYIMESADAVRYAGKNVTLNLALVGGPNFSAAGNNVNVSVNCGTGTDQGVNTLIFTGLTGQTIPLSAVQAVSTAAFARYAFNFNVPAGCTQIGVQVFYTPTGTAGADDSLYIANPRFFEGIDMPNFAGERSIGEELLLCQRTYEKSYDQSATLGTATANGICVGAAWATTNMVGTRWKVEKRVAPTVALWSRNGTANKVDNANGAADIATTVVGAGIGTAGMHRLDNAGASLVAGNQYEFQYTADSELLS